MEDIKKSYFGSTDYLLVYSELITSARYRGVATYQAIAQLLGLPLYGSHMGREIGQVVGEISENEIKQGRPMLSAICVGVSGLPGPGFYGFARALGRLKSSNREDELKFWKNERDAVYDAWARKFKQK